MRARIIDIEKERECVSQALYRKYRSRGFDEVVGQQHVTDLLSSAIKNGAISHAYLFTGPRGTGKTSVARIVAHAINDLPYTEDSTHLDIIEIDAASNRRIDDIRDLREKVYIAPSTSKYKVYIIDEVHMLTGESFNALLKTLEEPPAHAVFILATTELHKVPATIISRTQRFHFRPGTIKDVSAHLRHIANEEKIDITDEALQLIAEHSEGGFRDSVSLLDQVASIGDGAVDVDTVENLLGLAPRDRIDAIVTDIIDARPDAAVQKIHTLLQDGMSIATILLQLTRALSSHAPSHPELYPILYEIIELPKSFAPQLKLLALIGKQRQGGESGEERQVAKEEGRKKKEEEVSTAKATVTKKQEVTMAKEVDEKPTNIPTATDTSSIDWTAILEETKRRAPALYSILKRAEASIQSDKIILHFSFSLHRKKMNDDKQRRELTSIITNLYGSSPMIDVVDDKAKLDKTAEAVADIMGGGEPVSLPKDSKK